MQGPGARIHACITRFPPVFRPTCPQVRCTFWGCLLLSDFEACAGSLHRTVCGVHGVQDSSNWLDGAAIGKMEHASSCAFWSSLLTRATRHTSRYLLKRLQLASGS